MRAPVPRSSLTATSSGCSGISASNAIFLPSGTSIVRASAGTRSIGVTTTPTKGVSGEYGWAGSPFGTECHSPTQVPYSCGSRATSLRTRIGQPAGSSSSPAPETIGQSAGRLSISSAYGLMSWPAGTVIGRSLIPDVIRLRYGRCSVGATT